MGFGICFTCGYLMTFMSFRLFIKLVEGNPAPFVFLYTSGNIMSLMSSIFLSGPKRQFKSMFDEKRRVTSITYLVTLACSIAVCFIPIPTGPKIGVLVLCKCWYYVGAFYILHLFTYILILDIGIWYNTIPFFAVLLVQSKFFLFWFFLYIIIVTRESILTYFYVHE